FTGRRSSAPNANRPASGAEKTLQLGKMVSLAQKRGEVGGQRINKTLTLRVVTASLQNIQVLTETTQTQLADATCQSAVHHPVFLARQDDARPAVNELADTVQVVGGKPNIAVDHVCK